MFCNQKITISHLLQAENAKPRKWLSEILTYFSNFHTGKLKQSLENTVTGLNNIKWHSMYSVILWREAVFSFFCPGRWSLYNCQQLPEEGHERDHVRKINSLKQMLSENRTRQVTHARYSKHNISSGCFVNLLKQLSDDEILPLLIVFDKSVQKSKVHKKAFSFCFWGRKRKPNLMFTDDVSITGKKMCQMKVKNL